MVLKTMNKTEIFKSRSIDTVLNERTLLSQLMNPFIINMRFAFQDESMLYLVSEYYPGGDLSYYLHYKRKRFNETQAKFIIACLLQGLEFMHANGVMHRDIDPSNIVFDEDGYIRLIDFGYSRVWQPLNSSDASGTPGYMAPEILVRQNHSFESDFFAVGVILYELMLLRRPYLGDDRVSYKEQVLAEQIILKKNDVPDQWNLEAAHFINQCMRRRPQTRLGVNGVAELKAHVWFKDYDWKSIQERTMKPPYKPSSRGYRINKEMLKRDLDPESS